MFYTIHSHGLLLVWDLAKSKEPESVNDLNLKDGSEVTTADLWEYIVTSSNLCTNLLVRNEDLLLSLWKLLFLSYAIIPNERKCDFTSNCFQAIGFSNGEVQLHSLSKLSAVRDSKNQNKSLSNVIKAFKDLWSQIYE